MQIKTLSGADLQTVIYDAFQDAFSDYAITIDHPQFMGMIKRRGFHPDFSFGAFDGEKLVAFCLHGIDLYNNKLTAYDIATGTRVAYRGQGLAGKIMEHAIPVFNENNVHQYVLEVLQKNTRAYTVYQKAGFIVAREFNFFVEEQQSFPSADIPHELIIQPVSLTDIKPLYTFWDFTPSWQNSFDSIQRALDGFLMFGASLGDQIVGYIVFEPSSGDITQLAIDKKYRRRKIATALLHTAIQYNKSPVLKLINADCSCEAMTAFMESQGMPLKGKQLEMVRPI